MGIWWQYLVAVREARIAAEERDRAKRQENIAQEATRDAETALRESEKRLALNYFAYGRLCAVAARLATADYWENGGELRREFQNLYKAINLLGDETVKPALNEFTNALERWEEDGPRPPELRQRALDLGMACRKPWTNLMDRECRELADQVRRLLYERAIRVVEEMTAAANWEKAAGARREFEQLYWGELVMVESEEVEQAMVRLGEVVRGWKQGIPPRAQLRRLAGELRKACQLPVNSGRSGR